MSEPVWIGVDLGTQSVRALAVDDAGRPVHTASRPLTSVRRGDRHEQEPLQWWSSAADALAEVMASVGDREVGGVAVCATSGTVLLTDRAGAPLTPGLMYDDSRAGALALSAQEAGSEVWDRLGYRIQPAWALPKLLWWAGEGLLRDGVRMIHQPDVITSRLVGRPVAADSSHALKSGYDLLAGGWPLDVLDRLRLNPDVLPPVVTPGSVLGEVGPAAAQRTGLPVGTPVVAGMTDGCAAQLGAGALTPGEWNSVLGTTLALKGVTRTLLHDPTGAVYSHRAPHGDLWLPGGASSTGAGAVAALFPGVDLGPLTAAAERVRDVPTCYPLTGHGERFPFVRPDARGFLDAAPLPSAGGADARLFAAVCHGVAYLERLCFDLLDGAGADVSGPVSFTGGASRNSWWNQLRCDLLHVPVRIPDNAEPSLGMAVLAAGAAGGDVVGAAGRLVHVRTVLEPDTDRTADLATGYHAFLAALTGRGWLDESIADHARRRVTDSPTAAITEPSA